MSISQFAFSLTAVIISLISLGNSFFTMDDWIAVFGKGKISFHSSAALTTVLVLIAVEIYLIVGTLVMLTTITAYIITFHRFGGPDLPNLMAYGILSLVFWTFLRLFYKNYDHKIGLIKSRGHYYRLVRLIDSGYLVDDFGKNPDDKLPDFMSRVILPTGVVTERGTQILIVSQNEFYNNGFEGSIREKLDSAPKHI